MSCCKQHVYVCSSPDGTTEFPKTIPGGEKIFEVPGEHALYVARVLYGLVLRDPLEDAMLEFLWPIRIDNMNGHTVVRFVVLEKNLSSYFERPYYVSDRSVDEKAILKQLAESYSLEQTDLHKGVKKLWADGFMDSTRAEYKKPLSTAREMMDQDMGIKEHNPELYEVLLESVLYNALFSLSPDSKRSVSTFSVDPSRGYIGFPRYSTTSGDTDFVIREIVKHN